MGEFVLNKLHRSQGADDGGSNSKSSVRRGVIQFSGY
jgi:hypothetical protein